MAVEKEKKLYAYQEKFHLKVKVWISMIELLIVFHMKMYFQGTHPFVIYLWKLGLMTIFGAKNGAPFF